MSVDVDHLAVTHEDHGDVPGAVAEHGAVEATIQGANERLPTLDTFRTFAAQLTL